MSQPYIGEIRIFAGNFEPVGWMFCKGQVLAIADYDVLFNLIGTTYGGDGQTTFALPDLQGRVPVHQGPGYTIGQWAGAETVTLAPSQLPVHTHPQYASNTGTPTANPSNAVFAAWPDSGYATGSPDTPLAPDTLSTAGANLPHDNMPPYVAISYIISLFGIFPSQT